MKARGDAGRPATKARGDHGRPTTMDDAVPLAAFLTAEGFDTAEARVAAREVLHAAGLSNPRKSAITAAKLPACRSALREALVRSCGLAACERSLAVRAPRKHLVRVLPASCEHCGGVASRRTGGGVSARCLELGVRRVLVVGGLPAACRELRAALSGVEVDLVEGTAKRDAKRAKAELSRADIVVIWGNTPLDHSVSALYRRPPAGVGLVLVPTRGAASVLAALAVHLEGRAKRR